MTKTICQEGKSKGGKNAARGTLSCSPHIIFGIRGFDVHSPAPCPDKKLPRHGIPVTPKKNYSAEAGDSPSKDPRRCLLLTAWKVRAGIFPRTPQFSLWTLAIFLVKLVMPVLQARQLATDEEIADGGLDFERVAVGDNQISELARFNR